MFSVQAVQALRKAARRIGPVRRVYAKADAIVRYWPQMRSRPVLALRFILADREYDNYTYEISNRPELAAFLARVLELEPARTGAFIAELEDDDGLRSELNAALARRPDRRHVALYGRRAGWYAIVRACRPRVVVEIGVHDGLGSTVMLQALDRNGGDGRLIGIDVDPASGWLVPARLRGRYELVIQDSAIAVPQLAARERIDMLVVDGDHGYEHEQAEYADALAALAPGALIVSDTARRSSALRDFAERHGCTCWFWAERSVDHFFAGEGIGVVRWPPASGA